jgi:hypothetical protein
MRDLASLESELERTAVASHFLRIDLQEAMRPEVLRRSYCTMVSKTNATSCDKLTYDLAASCLEHEAPNT